MEPAITWSGQAALSLIFAAALGGCAPPGSQTSSAALDAIGCQFDAKEVCEHALAHPVNFSSGITTSNQSYFQQNAPATAWEQVPIKSPGGSEVDVQCQVNTQNRTGRWSTHMPHRAARYRTATVSG